MSQGGKGKISTSGLPKGPKPFANKSMSSLNIKQVCSVMLSSRGLAGAL